MTMSSGRITLLMDHLESLGEMEVRRLLPLGRFGEIGSDERSRVEDWLESQKTAREIDIASIARDAASSAREANEIARSASSTAEAALRTARQERTAAWIAAIAAIIAAVVASIR